MSHKVDPDLGIIAVDFLPAEERVKKANPGDPDAVLDVFEVADQIQVVRRRYMLELERDGNQPEYSANEVLRRWARAHLTPHKLPTAVVSQIVNHVYAEIDRLKKDAEGSSTPV